MLNPTGHRASLATDPIGVFDSSVGGLSVLRALLQELPGENFVYLGDSAHAPYGEREEAHVIARTSAVADYLHRHQHIKALVVACNTATASAISPLRASYPDMPLVGIEPALKPARMYSKTRKVGVMATRGTLRSEKFNLLLKSVQGDCRFVLQACDGLADAIEHADTEKIRTLCAQYVEALGAFGTQQGHIDTLVLGCTHYPFAAEYLQSLVGTAVRLLEPGAPVAKQTRRLLTQANLLHPTPPLHAEQDNAPRGAATQVHETRLRFFTTGAPQMLASPLRQWLYLESTVEKIAL